MLWFILFLSSITSLSGMDHTKSTPKRKFTYRLPNAFNPKDPDKVEFRAHTFQVTQEQFDHISAMSNSFAQHIQNESTYLEADVQHLFNRMQHSEYHKKPKKSHADIAQKLEKEHVYCKNKLLALMTELRTIETKSDDSKDQKLDLLEKKITKLSREFMTLSHTRNLHLLHTTKKRIEKMSRERMRNRLKSLFELLEYTKKQFDDTQGP